MDNKEQTDEIFNQMPVMGWNYEINTEYNFESDNNTYKTSNCIEYSDNLKIVDKYTFSNRINEDELDELENILCLSEINKPELFKNTSMDVHKNKDVLEKIFLIYELHDDFETSNINMLLDLLDDVSFKVIIGGSSILNLNLGFVSFICDEIGEDIIYLNIVELKEQIQNGEFNYHTHKYRELLEHLLEDNQFGNKILIIPIFLGAFINKLPLKLFKYNDLRYSFSGNDKLKQYINNIYVSNQTINFVNRKNIPQSPKFKLTILQMDSRYGNINIGRDISNYTFNDFLWFNTTNYKYFTIKISPNYAEIDKNIWNDVINILPNINSISYCNNQENKTNTYTVSEIALIRKTTNGHIYAFSTNPDIPIKNFIANTIKENGDGLELIYNGLYVLQNKDKTHQSYKKYSKCKRKENQFECRKIDLQIALNIETPTIPINIIVNTYRKNDLVFKYQMVGAQYG